MHGAREVEVSRIKRKGQRDLPGQELLFDAERHCVRCGRRLRGDRSVKRQYGPTCWKRRKSCK